LVLISYFLSLIRALSLPCIYIFVFMQWLRPFEYISLGHNTTPEGVHCRVLAGSQKKKDSVHKRRVGLLMSTPDFSQTGLLPLTTVFLMNAWFVNILTLNGYHYSDLLMALGAKIYLILTLVLSIAYIWFVPPLRKPPDILSAVPTSEGVKDEDACRPSCFDTKLRIYHPDEVSLTETSLHSESDTSSCQSRNEENVLHHEFGMDDRSHEELIKPRIIKSQVLLGLQHGEKYCFNECNERFDLTSIQFVNDTGSSDHLCKDKNLYIGDIIPLQHVKLQGVGGLTEAKGYGTIRFSLFDDDGMKHAFTIHNVLYVPAAPMNLLSPQKWIAGLTESERRSRGTMSITFDDVTILVWGGQRFMKTMHHRPDMNIPLLAVNEDLNNIKKEDTILPSQFCQPCVPCYMHTSKAICLPAMIQDDDGDEVTPGTTPMQSEGVSGVHLIPNDDNEIVNDDVDHQLLNDDAALIPDNELLEEQTDDKDVAISEVHLNEEQASELIKVLKRPLSDLEQEFLLIHHKLKHLPERYLHRMAEQGIIPKKFRKVKLPPCAACIFGKQSKRPWRTKGTHKSSVRRKEHIHPGDGTSVDQLESRHPGLVPQAKGFHRTKAKYVGATVFVDHATGFTYVHLIKDFTGEENLEAKNAYETKAAEFGIRIRNYHGDNGRFSEALWLSDVAEKNQKVTFCGVGSHHQNGIAEKKIRDLTEYARTLLVAANQTWPEAVKLALWPFALKEAERVFNELRVDEQGLTPIQRFARCRTKLDLKQEHPLFCPTYALDASLQGDGKLPRWDPRSRAGVYLGRSKHHASNVALILNLETGNVSPQYHLTFDDKFSTVPYLRQREKPPFWEELVKTQTEFYGDSAGYASGDSTTDTARNLVILKELQEVFADNLEYPQQSDKLLPLDTLDKESADMNELSNVDVATSTDLDLPVPAKTAASEGDIDDDEEDAAADPTSSRVRFVDEFESDSTNAKADDLDIQYYDVDNASKRRSSRSRKVPNRYGYHAHLQKRLQSFTALFNASRWSGYLYNSVRGLATNGTPKLDDNDLKKEIHAQSMINLNMDGTYNYLHPLSFAATTDNDTYMFHEMLRQPDKDEFVKAMVKELSDHTSRRHWIAVKRSTIGSAKTIKAIWSFKRKRRPDGTVSKHKARLCAHGGMQVHGDTFWETYAPVVNWMSVRLMLTFSEIHQLHTRSIDFTLAFPQANVKVDIYMELPLGCSTDNGGNKNDHVLKLIKNLYGLRDASKTWFEHLKKGLLDLDFKPSSIDPCIFYKKGLTLIVYVDDCLVFCKKREDADQLIKDLMKSYSLTDEGELGSEGETVSSYLGVQVVHDKVSGEIRLTQPYLIERILKLLGSAVDQANVKHTPAEFRQSLHKDKDGPERKQDWSYRSAIGMLNYLAASTRPDILYAVHAAARFSADPKLIHEQAVKRICRYLKGTCDKGIILRPDKSRGIECYVDASFASDWDRTRSDDPSTVLSRTGYTLLYMGCPVLFVSKMQTEIALSTTEAEYIALSQAMRDLIPFSNMAKELGNHYHELTGNPKILCRLFEDNNGALLLAKEHRYRPRTKHIALKYHHFRAFVNEKRVDILPIDTKEQLADQFTKPLDVQTFQYLRRKLIGW
jgi:hypothetical protein